MQINDLGFLDSLTRTWYFCRQVLPQFPFSIISYTALVTAKSFIDSIAVLSIAPIVEIVVNPDLENLNGFMQQLFYFVEWAGIPTTLNTFILVFLCLSIFRSVISVIVGHALLRIKYVIQRDIMGSAFEAFFNANWFFFTSSSRGQLINTFVRESGLFGDAISSLGRLFASGIHLAFYVTLPLLISWQVTLASGLVAVVLAVPFLLLNKASHSLGSLNTKTGNQWTSTMHELLNAAKIILGFGNQRAAVKQFYRSVDEHRLVTIKSQTLSLFTHIMYEPVGAVVIIVAFFVAQYISVPLSTLVVLLYALMRIVPELSNILRYLNQTISFLPSYEQVKLLQESARRHKESSGSRPFYGLKESISINQLTFRYANSPKDVLTDVSMSIGKGAIVGIVGESGAGKSTLVDIIMGLHRPTSGAIEIDGVSLQEIDIVEYRKSIGYVPQDSILFDLSIRDNLLWAKESATHTEIKLACDMANASGFIEKLPNGYETLVGDRGVRLSGGQVQRLALARALLRKPSLIILDEATSALDNRSEQFVQDALQAIDNDTTIVVVAHRLSTIVDADHIYVLNSGCIVEQGTYRQLMDRKGEFYRMYEVQE